LQEDAELDVIRLVHPQLAADVFDLLGIADLARHHDPGIAPEKVEKDEDEQHDPEHRRDHLPQSSYDIGPHRGFLLLRAALWVRLQPDAFLCKAKASPTSPAFQFVLGATSTYCHVDVNIGCLRKPSMRGWMSSLR